MPLDNYSPCPGGLKKKIKFCCSDLLGEWQKLERTLESDQYAAALQHVESLLQKHPDRACLLAERAFLLRAEDHFEEAGTAAADFLARFPDNPLALGEAAIHTALSKDPRAAVPILERAMDASGDSVSGRVYEAIGIVAQALMAVGEPLAARHLTMVQAALLPDDHQPIELILEFNRTDAPLLLKTDLMLGAPPADASWKGEFAAVEREFSRFKWTAARQQVEQILQRYPEEPYLCRALAILRAVSAETPQAIEALRRYAGLPIPWDDAVEAEGLALLLSASPLGDNVDMNRLEYTVQDVEQVQSALLSSQRVAAMPGDPSEWAEADQPPPKGAYLLLDRSMPLSGAGMTVDSVPQVLCRIFLFGRQTDRDARLVVEECVATDVPQVQSALRELAPSLGEPKAEKLGEVSATRDSLVRSWRLPPDVGREQFDELSGQHWQRALDALLDRPLGCLDGKSPREAAADGRYRARLAAIVEVVQHWLDASHATLAADRLREPLGLPQPETIDPAGVSLEELSLPRLERVDTEKASDEALTKGFERAMAHNARRAVEKFARAIAGRASLAGSQTERMAIMMLARLSADSPTVLGYIERGRKASAAAKESCASWDLMELPIRLRQGEGQEAVRLLNHLTSDHRREPRVMETLARLMAELGLLTPDGRMAVPMPREEPGIIVPGQEEADPGKLWTPDSAAPAGEKKSRLWTPDSF